MASNRGVVYIKPGEVQVQSIEFPKLADPTNGRKIEHGVILTDLPKEADREPPA